MLVLAGHAIKLDGLLLRLGLPSPLADIAQDDRERTTAYEIRLTNNVTIAVHSNSFRLIRGRTLLAGVFDEIAFWRDDTSANPDIETYRAVRPSLARTGGMLIGISSPYRRAGLLHQKFKTNYGVDDEDVLVVRGGTARFNPTIDQAVIAKEMAADPESARSEWGAEFRTDVSSLFDDPVIDDAIDHARPLELPPRGGRRYHAFADASAGRHDAFCSPSGTARARRARRPGSATSSGAARPRSIPRAVAQEYAHLAREYGCSKDHRRQLRWRVGLRCLPRCGIKYERSPLPKSRLVSGSAARTSIVARFQSPITRYLLRELRGLERRTHRSGKDSVDHGSHGSDDFANALCGALYIAMHELRRPKMRMGGIRVDGAIIGTTQNRERQPHHLAQHRRARARVNPRRGSRPSPPEHNPRRRGRRHDGTLVNLLVAAGLSRVDAAKSDLVLEQL